MSQPDILKAPMRRHVQNRHFADKGDTKVVRSKNPYGSPYRTLLRNLLKARTVPQ